MEDYVFTYFLFAHHMNLLHTLWVLSLALFFGLWRVSYFFFILRNEVMWCLNYVGSDVEGALFSSGSLPRDYPMKIVWKKGFIRLVLVGGILWILLILIASLFHIWSCQSSISFFSGILSWFFHEAILVTMINHIHVFNHQSSICLLNNLHKDIQNVVLVIHSQALSFNMLNGLVPVCYKFTVRVCLVD